MDHMSALPIEIITIIISFLPIVDAIRLCFLRREWYFSNLWIHSTIFELKEKSFRRPETIRRYRGRRRRSIAVETRQNGRIKFLQVFNRVLFSLVSPVISSFSFHHLTYTTSHRNEIDRWIEFALSKGVRDLVLNFSVDFPINQSEPWIVIIKYHLPDVLYQNASSIRTLSINSCRVDARRISSFKNIRSLTLTRIKISVRNIGHMVPQCPLLENLCLVECFQEWNLKINSMSLKRLIVRHSKGFTLMEIRLPRLEYFEYAGDLIRFDLDLLYALEEAVMDFTMKYISAFAYWYEDAREYFSGLAAVRQLKICTNAFKESFKGVFQIKHFGLIWQTILTAIDMLADIVVAEIGDNNDGRYAIWMIFPQNYLRDEPFLRLRNAQELTLTTTMERYEVLGILSIITSATHLRTLTFIAGHRRPLKELMCDYYSEELDEFLHPDESSVSNRLLEVIVEGFMAKQYEMEILKFLVGSATMLRTITLLPRMGYSERRIAAAAADLLSVRAASDHLQINW
ncbi:putative F-box/LRR-repeat protein At1g56400 [Tripterygium wilfordii]|uniref:putative F-box/LRR-repeat protein At1g56400 n=1 Tax=Tripterygium wilfordii TaxID=458696 RepID=UPI0018F854A4|nr:putative F-box/LRR-repeat protein At1g56400 [Tripterygium wilfordii]